MPECLDDFNKKASPTAYQMRISRMYTFDDMFDPMRNLEVCEWYLTRELPWQLAAKGLYESERALLAAYNCGAGRYSKEVFEHRDLPAETLRYIRKYHSAMDDAVLIKCQAWVKEYRLLQKGAR